MSISIIGLVGEIKRGKPYQTKFGEMVTTNITIETDNGNVVVQRAGMANKTFNLAGGTKVQATYEEKTTEHNGNVYVNNKLVKDGLVILNEKTGEALPVSATGEAKPAQAPFGSKGGNPEGARHGMIVNNSVALATARGDLSLKALLQAADDVKTLTEHVEAGKKTEAAEASKPALKRVGAQKASPTTQVLDDDDENPFDLD